MNDVDGRSFVVQHVIYDGVQLVLVDFAVSVEIVLVEQGAHVRVVIVQVREINVLWTHTVINPAFVFVFFLRISKITLVSQIWNLSDSQLMYVASTVDITFFLHKTVQFRASQNFELTVSVVWYFFGMIIDNIPWCILLQAGNTSLLNSKDICKGKTNCLFQRRDCRNSIQFRPVCVCFTGFICSTAPGQKKKKNMLQDGLLLLPRRIVMQLQFDSINLFQNKGCRQPEVDPGRFRCTNWFPTQLELFPCSNILRSCNVDSIELFSPLSSLAKIQDLKNMWALRMLATSCWSLCCILRADSTPVPAHSVLSSSRLCKNLTYLVLLTSNCGRWVN